MRIIRVMKDLAKIGLSILLILMGIGVYINPTPIPGTDKLTTSIIAILLIGFGGALYKIMGIRADERVRERVRREER